MKAIDLIKKEEALLNIEGTTNKKMKTLAETLNNLMIEMNQQMIVFESFNKSQIDGDLANKIIVAKSLAEFFVNNKFLKVENTVEAFKNQEKANIDTFYNKKDKLIETISTLIKECSREAVVSNYDVFEGDFRKCEEGHEIIILGDRNIVVLDTLLNDLEQDLVVDGNFDKVEAQSVDYNLETLFRNIDACNAKNEEINGSKQGKMAKIESMIARLKESGEQVVAFYTYKDALLDIGCSEKGVRDYEHELSKVYIPLKKALQKEFKIELEDICNVAVNEEEYSEESIEENNDAQVFDEAIQENKTTSDEEVNVTNIDDLI